MKKIHYLFIVTFISTFFLLPPSTHAIIGADCSTAACDAGETCFQGLCQGSNTTTGGATGGGLNLTLVSSWSNSIKTFINTILVPLLIAVAFIVFLYGVFNYFILGGADEEKRTKGRTYIMYGIIGFVIIFSFWGIVNVVASLFGLGSGARPAALKYPEL